MQIRRRYRDFIGPERPSILLLLPDQIHCALADIQRSLEHLTIGQDVIHHAGFNECFAR
ncbi:Uncharacterised protein [Vibrio cholerae]|nr:Uncharacterised protein [Vibrio cholerae]CSC70636.1 Uncharacterised protein [Vibrio cholerae]CSI75608.1 Uncharacterised protein [Vibrio cholerae]